MTHAIRSRAGHAWVALSLLWLTSLLKISDLRRVVLPWKVGLHEVCKEGCAAGEVRLEICGLSQGEIVQYCSTNAADHLH